MNHSDTMGQWEPARRIALLAGEASGDRLGGRLMEALRQNTAHTLDFSGVGGVHMEAQGLNSLFPMQDIALMGFAEIIPHVFALKRRIRETVAYLESINPEILVTIDSPGFNNRVVEKLCQRSVIRPRYVHYVAPTVWAYKPKRAEKTARLFDQLLCLLPFEPPYFEACGLEATFVGHPVVDEPYDAQARTDFRSRYQIAEDAIMLCMMPGSRAGELSRLLPVFKETLEQVLAVLPGLHLVMPTAHAMRETLEEAVADWPITPLIIVEEHEKKAAMQAANVGLVKSGTIALEAAMAGLPMITTYQVNPLSAWLLRRMIRVRYVNLLNVIEDAEIIPEFLQENCRADLLTPKLRTLLLSRDARQTQRKKYRKALDKLKAPDGQSAAGLAAEHVLKHLA